jgi:hypothetical protein
MDETFEFGLQTVYTSRLTNSSLVLDGLITKNISLPSLNFLLQDLLYFLEWEEVIINTNI